MVENDPRLLLLDPRDNVLIARDQIAAGETVAVEGHRAAISVDIRLGHKVARRPIANGEQIWKYGAPIGRATRAIAQAEHVHVHNIASDYTPTYVINDEAKEAAGGAS